MARELILIPKVKYQKLFSDGDKLENNDELKKKSENNKEKAEEREPQDLITESDKSDLKRGDNVIEVPPIEVPRRNMRKKKQRGGKLYIETTPSDFSRGVPKGQIKRKWLSFKL